MTKRKTVTNVIKIARGRGCRKRQGGGGKKGGPRGRGKGDKGVESIFKSGFEQNRYR